MIKKLAYFLLLSGFLLYSCNQPSDIITPLIINPDSILKDQSTVWFYIQKNIKVFDDFTAFNADSNKITKDSFFSSLITGKYLPLRIVSKDSSSSYKLYSINDSVKNDVRSTIKNWANIEYIHCKMQGKRLPDFSFADLNGNIYNNKNTKGKLLILKCWFINCHACVEEIPALNSLVNEYKNRKDIIFVSLATDPTDSLKKFLSHTNFNYSMVANQQKFISEDLKIDMFPTHFIINKEGIIKNVINDSKELKILLNKESLK